MTIYDMEQRLLEAELEKTSTTPTDTITWDEYHCSPRAEVILVSSDMIGFRVDAWYLKKKR